jgi:hypothetical protein
MSGSNNILDFACLPQAGISDFGLILMERGLNNIIFNELRSSSTYLDYGKKWHTDFADQTDFRGFYINILKNREAVQHI